MDEKRRITRAERTTTVGPLDRPMDVLENPPRSSLDKPLPEIRAPLADDMSNLAIEDAASVDQQVRNALTDPRIFETIPAAFSLSFVLGKQPADADSLSLDDLISQGQYYLIILRTQHLLTTQSSTLSTADLWSLWLLRAESLRLLLAPRLAALELNRIKVPPSALIPWDFQLLKILLTGMASGRWRSALNQWCVMVSESRMVLSEAGENKDLWRLRLRRLEDLIVYALIESKDYDAAIRELKRLTTRDPAEYKYITNLFRVYLQMGLLGNAESLLPSLAPTIQVEASALLALAKEDYATAAETYSSLLQDRKHTLAYTNNLALTHLYSTNGQSAITVLEPALKESNNLVGVLPHTLYNLCTMYEIRDDNSRARKEALMEHIVGRYGDVCGKVHFKLDSLR